MCVLTDTRVAKEALVRFEDRTIFVAYELSCGCTRLRAATMADLESLPVIEGEPDTEASETPDEPALPALALAA